MPALTINDLNNGKTYLEHIAAVATSPALTATDSLGKTKRTLAGIDNFFNVAADGILAQSTAQAESSAVNAAAAITAAQALDAANATLATGILSIANFDFGFIADTPAGTTLDLGSII